MCVCVYIHICVFVCVYVLGVCVLLFYYLYQLLLLIILYIYSCTCVFNSSSITSNTMIVVVEFTITVQLNESECLYYIYSCWHHDIWCVLSAFYSMLRSVLHVLYCIEFFFMALMSEVMLTGTRLGLHATHFYCDSRFFIVVCLIVLPDIDGGVCRCANFISCCAKCRFGTTWNRYLNSVVCNSIGESFQFNWGQFPCVLLQSEFRS